MSAAVVEATGQPVSPESVRAAAREWIAQSWNPDEPLQVWREKLAGAGWAIPSWPVGLGGRGLPAWADEIVADELAAATAPGAPVGSGVHLAAPTIMAHGPASLAERFVLPILTGQERWCQLFSEPGAGSDLAGLTTRAVLEGDEWVISGQKVWNTSADHADFGLLLARTDMDAPKHRGITYFLVPMRQPGVEVRPLRQMNGHSSFNEVFFDGARIPAEYVVGEVNNGWRAAITTLAFERKVGALRRPEYPDTGQRAYVEATQEVEEHFKPYSWYPQRAGRVDLVFSRARETGADKNPVIRQEIARLISLDRVSQWTVERAQINARQGKTPGPEGSLSKLSRSVIARQAAKVHSMISGADAMLSGPDGAHGGVIAEILTSYPGQSIAGGTDEIQHNILGEKFLGLPGEPNDDKTRPFRSIPRNG